ncbi:hypothetical protein [Geoglobus acetivorans]|uniref:Archaeal flagella protein FlaD/E domain-containing protein n=1 Tax=Geoglobus acetivorans TaxID=565033 RepID=A0A0A7GFI4_GEOAI|nr:hypothetical protein GACE_0655 [Geoglobus acetivorans]
MQEGIDESVVDDILKTAEADTPEGKLEKLEKEVDLIKGSIKKLLIDIRETLNNIENPFQNLQSLAEGLGYAASQAPPPQQIQIIPGKPLEEQMEEETQEAQETPAEEEAEVPAEPVGGVNGDMRGVKPFHDNITSQDKVESEEKSNGGESIGMEVIQPEFGALDDMGKDMLFADKKLLKYDIEVLFEIMGWVRGMLEKYSIESLKLMLGIFESAGYIKEETAEFVSQIADLIVMNDNFEEIVFELYRLYKILYPEDRTIDSKVLSLILDRKIVM